MLCFMVGLTDSLPSPPEYCSQGPEKRKEYNIKDNLVRFSCGVEDVEDIWNDLDQALLKAVSKRGSIVDQSASKVEPIAVPVS